MISVATDRGGLLASRAELVDGREVAWAEQLVSDNVLYAWILGRYVTTGAPNQNGHVFALADLPAATGSLVHAPLNMLHRPRNIFGTYVGAEIVYPTAEADAEPYMESLAAMWRYYFREEYESIRAFHKMGMLAQSMECVPETVSCGADGCGATFAYAGRADPSYCEHLNVASARRTLNKPHFCAGAIVVPPGRPAWSGAKVTELMAATRRRIDAPEAADVAADLYDQVVGEFPGLDPAGWERVMAALVAMTPTVLPDRADPARRARQPGAPSRQPGALLSSGMGTAAMVALYPPPEVAAEMALPGGEAAGELHITLAYLGSQAVLQLDREAVEAGVASFAASAAALEGAVAGIGRFTAGYPAGQEAWPLIALIDIPALPEFRQRLVAVLEAVGVGVNREHGFCPHLTLDYVDPDGEAAAAQLLAQGLEPRPLQFAEVVLAWGDARIRFPLATAKQADEPSRDVAAAIAGTVARGRRDVAAMEAEVMATTMRRAAGRHLHRGV